MGRDCATAQARAGELIGAASKIELDSGDSGGNRDCVRNKDSIRTVRQLRLERDGRLHAWAEASWDRRTLAIEATYPCGN